MFSIFIRTYHRDIKWLNYCLASIHKNLKGFDEIVVCIPTGQESLLSHLTYEKVVTCKIAKDDYNYQQYSKLQAHKYCNGDYIMYVDSDVVFFSGADVRDYFEQNKPIILMDKYENVGGAICWKKPTEKLFGESIEYEYMRTLPLVYHKSTLEMFNNSFPNIENYIISQPYRKFSEFNVLGFFAEKMQKDEYYFVDLSKENNNKPNKSKQYWSWSNMTEAERQEIENTI